MVTNVYLSCDNFSNTVVSDSFLDCINCIEGILALANCDSYVLCGDFNSSFQRVTAQSMVWYGNVLFDIIEYAMPENRF